MSFKEHVEQCEKRGSHQYKLKHQCPWMEVLAPGYLRSISRVGFFFCFVIACATLGFSFVIPSAFVNTLFIYPARRHPK